MKNFEKFKTLHAQKTPFHIGNAWDANSAIMLEKNNYKAIGTSSDAIATSLGYQDGEEISFDELLHVVKTIKSKISLPLTVDIEAGYSRDPNIICNNIIKLIELGVVGVNLEDSIVTNGNRDIVDAHEFSETINFIKNNLLEKDVHIFLNIRTDPYLMGLENPLKEAMNRCEFYEKSGADGLFVPCITDEKDIKTIVDNTSVPINVLAMPDLPSFSKLEQLGVKRISSGSFLYSAVNKYFNELSKEIHTHKSFSPVFK